MANNQEVAESLLGKLVSWYDFEDNTNDGWGPFPLTDTSSGAGTFSLASAFGSGVSGKCIVNGRDRTRLNFPDWGASRAFFIGGFRSTNLFTDGQLSAFIGRATFNECAALSESASGFRSQGTNGATVYAADAAASTDTWYLTIMQHDAAGTIRNHQNATLNAATNAGSATLNPSSFISLGNVARTVGNGAVMASLFLAEGEVTQDEATYLYNFGAGRTMAEIIADAAYEKPAHRFTTGDLSISYSGKMVGHDSADGVSQFAKANLAVSSGKRWFSVKNSAALSATQTTFLGVVNTADTSYTIVRIGGATPGVQLVAGVFTVGTNPTMTRAAAGDNLMCAVDFAARKVWFGKNNVWSGDPVAGTGHAATFSSAQDLHVFLSGGDSAFSGKLSVLTGEMPYADPTGYTPWGD